MVLLPSDYKKRTRTREIGRAKTGQVSKQGLVLQTEHWDGSMDANVHPAPFHMRIKGNTPDGRTVLLVNELEKAIREHEIALKSGDVGWIRRTTAQVEGAKARLVAQQGVG